MSNWLLAKVSAMNTCIIRFYRYAEVNSDTTESLGVIKYVAKQGLSRYFKHISALKVIRLFVNIVGY